MVLQLKAMVRTLAVVSSTMRLRADAVIAISPILPVLLSLVGRPSARTVMVGPEKPRAIEFVVHE
jgi:hypothetical protein